MSDISVNECSAEVKIARFAESPEYVCDLHLICKWDCDDNSAARRFFENSSISAAITEIDESFIKSFHVIL